MVIRLFRQQREVRLPDGKCREDGGHGRIPVIGRFFIHPQDNVCVQRFGLVVTVERSKLLVNWIGDCGILKQPVVQRLNDDAGAVRYHPDLPVDLSEKGKKRLEGQFEFFLQLFELFDMDQRIVIDLAGADLSIADQQIQLPHFESALPPQPQETMHQIKFRQRQIHDCLHAGIAGIDRALYPAYGNGIRVIDESDEQ